MATITVIFFATLITSEAWMGVLGQPWGNPFQANVFTNLAYAQADAITNKMSSSVTQGSLPGITLGSAGSQGAEDIGAATSFGLIRTPFMGIIGIGAGAAKAKSSEAISKLVHSRTRKRSLESVHHLIRRDGASTATTLNEVSGPGGFGNMGSTGALAGPAATSISLGALLLRAHDAFAAVNGGATAAHAGSSDSTTSFSNSNLSTD